MVALENVSSRLFEVELTVDEYRAALIEQSGAVTVIIL